MSNKVVSTKVVPLSSEPTRRRLSERQAHTVHRLALAAVEELRERGYAGLTIRNVARRAGIAPATAYNYFTSKDHLVTEIFWRRIQALPEPPITAESSQARRVITVLEQVARILADEPELAAAAATATLAPDPDVKHLRELIGADIRRRLVNALGGRADPNVVTTLEMILSGAMVRAGTGHATYEELPGLLARTCTVVLGGER